MRKTAIKKTAITKVLSCFFVFVILMSAIPVSVLASDSSDDVGCDALSSLSVANTQEGAATCDLVGILNAATYDLSDCIYGGIAGGAKEALVGENTELNFVVALTEEPCGSRVHFDDPIQWFVYKPDGTKIIGETDTLKCCIVGGPYDNAFYDFPDAGEYTIKIEFLDTGDWASWTVSATNPLCSISNLAHYPYSPKDVDTVNLYADVTSVSTITSVKAYWSIDKVNWNIIDMKVYSGNTNITKSRVPAQAAGTTVHYKIHATNSGGTAVSSTSSYTIQATTTGSLTGRVTDSSGNGINGATVTLGDWTTTTDNTAHYSFIDKTKGEYDFKVEKSGYNTYIGTATVGTGKTTKDVQLTTGQSPEIELTPSSQDFGEVRTDVCTVSFSFTLKNVGGGTATGEVYLTGSDKDQFIITSGKGSFSLDADQTKTIGVAFSPTSAGSKSAPLYAKGSNCNDDQSSLSGTGEEVGQPPLEAHINIENVLINYDSNDPRNIIGPLKIVAEEKTTIEVILNNTGSQNFNGGDAWLHWETEDTDTSPITPVKEGSAPPIYIKKIPPIPIGSSVTIQFEDTFRVPSTPDQLNVYLNFYSEVDEYKTNTFNKRPIFIWPSGSDYISCTLGVFNVASGGIVKACKDAGMMVSSINYVLFVADVNKLIKKAKAREFDREYWYVISKSIISIGAAAKIAGAQILSIILGSLEAAIPCANILNIFIEINQAIHTALYEVGLDVLTVIVGSPANVCIIDDNGNICGIFEDGTIIDQIPGSYISQFDHFKIVSVPGDGSKDEIKIEGTDKGVANVTLFKPKEMSATGVMISYDKVPVSPTTKIRIDMNPTSNPTYAMEIDNDGDGTTDETKEPDSIESIRAEFPKLCSSPDPPSTNFGTVPKDQTRTWDFFITNSGSDTLTWTITCDQPSWLNVNPTSDSTTKEVDVVTVTIDTHELDPGTHTGHITIDSNGGRKIGTITVTVPPPAQEPKLCISPDPPTTNFGTVPKDQTRTRDFFITNCGSGTLRWTITCDQPSWLIVNPAMKSTTTIDVVTVTIDTHDLSPGTHTGHITLTSNGGDKTGTITVEVPSKPSTPNVGFKGIVLFPCTYSDFTGQSIEVTNILSDPNGKLANGKYVCTYWTDDTLAQIDNVAPGDEVEVYGTLIEDPDVAEVWLIVRLETSTHHIVRLKQGPPQLCTWPTTPSHDFGTVAKDQTRTWDFDVTNCGSGTLTWSISDDKNWISVYPTSEPSTTERDTVTVTISTSGLSPGTHTGHITLTSNGGDKTGTITVVVPQPQNQPPENPTLTPERSTPQLAGTTIKWTASATDPDGDTLYYQFRLKGSATGNSWTIKRDWSTANTWTWYTTASDVGDNVISVWIRDGHHASTSSYDLEKVYSDYTIQSEGNQPPVNPMLAPNKAEPQNAGTSITWTASATDPDGDPLYYQFWMRGPATGNSWTIKRDWSTANTWTWYTTASDVGDTDISVWIRDGHHASTSRYDLEKVYSSYTIQSEGNQLPVNPMLAPNKAEPQNAGTSITWTASATDPDGDSLYYRFWIKGPATGNSWTIKRDWSSAKTWTWYTTASDVGDTDITVWIRDRHHASTSSYDLKKTVYGYKITADKKSPTATIDSITPNPATQGKDTVRFKGHGYDSDGYIVDYYWKSSKDGKLSSSKEFTKSASKLAVATHTIYFKVKDDDGLWSDWATKTLKIKKSITGKPDLIVSSIKFKPNPASAGDDVVVSVTVKNQGKGDAGAHDEFLGQPYATVIHKEWHCSGLKSGASKTFTHTLKNFQGSVTYEACADWGGVVEESDEDNNCRTAYLEDNNPI